MTCVFCIGLTFINLSHFAKELLEDWKRAGYSPSVVTCSIHGNETST